MLEILFVIFAVTFILTLFAYKKFWRKFKLAQKLPGPKGEPLIGSGLEFLNKTQIQVKCANFITKSSLNILVYN